MRIRLLEQVYAVIAETNEDRLNMRINRLIERGWHAKGEVQTVKSFGSPHAFIREMER